eukprot:6671399-Prymnesium_polylepis.1
MHERRVRMRSHSAPDEAYGDLALERDRAVLLVDIVGALLGTPGVVRIRIAVDAELQVSTNDDGPGAQGGSEDELGDLTRVGGWADDVLCIRTKGETQVDEPRAVIASRDAD